MCMTFFVRPTSPPDVECPGSPCETLEHYSDHLSFLDEERLACEAVSVLFLNGTHQVLGSTSKSLSFCCSYELTISSNVKKYNQIFIHEFERFSINVNEVLNS